MTSSRQKAWRWRLAALLFGAAGGVRIHAAPPLPTVIEGAPVTTSPAPRTCLRPVPAAPDESPAAAPTLAAFADAPAPAEPCDDSEPDGRGLSDGDWVHRNHLGQSLARGPYLGGVRHGLWTRYFTADQLTWDAELLAQFQPPFTLEAPFQNGQLTGACKFYDGGRRVVAEWPLRGGVVHGSVVSYFPSGAIRQKTAVRHGLLHGERIRWDEDGNIIEQAEYADGLRFTKHEQPSSADTQSCTGGYVDAAQRFEANFDWWRGRAEIVPGTGEPGQLKHGRWTWWYANGHEHLQGGYHEGSPTGKFTWWYENGQRQLAGRYVGGVPHGKFVWYHPNGQKQLSAIYVDGRQAGEWMRWDAAGLVVERGETPIDPLACFIEHGSPINASTTAGIRQAAASPAQFR